MFLGYIDPGTGMTVLGVSGMIIAFFVKGFKKLNHPSRLVRGTTLGAMSGVTAILFHSIFDYNLHIPANAILFTVLAAIVVSPIPAAEGPVPSAEAIPVPSAGDTGLAGRAEGRVQEC